MPKIEQRVTLKIIAKHYAGVGASCSKFSPFPPPDRVVQVRGLGGDIVFTLLSRCPSPPRCINGYQRKTTRLQNGVEEGDIASLAALTIKVV